MNPNELCKSELSQIRASVTLIAIWFGQGADAPAAPQVQVR